MLAKLNRLPSASAMPSASSAPPRLRIAGVARNTRKITKNATVVIRASASSQAMRTVAIPKRCRWSLTYSATEMLGRS